ncbi:glycosyltransferase family 4 protein [Algibacter sp. R77976]|uniref:glycosyltransferase family 4 protein n=1 Tax=Algibacter sp. R77976 TaxID=3093873 RepID=UPI0037CBC848
MRIIWFTENYPPNKGGMSRSCDRIVSNLRQHYTVDVFHFTNKFPAFKTESHENGSYTSVPIFEDSSYTLNMLWAFIKDHSVIKVSTVFTAFGSHLCLKGITLMANWLQKPVLICFRGNDFDNAIFSQKKQDLLYTISNATAIACVSSEKEERIKRMKLNNNVYFTPNSIDFEQWNVLNSDRTLASQIKSGLQLTKNTKIIGLIGFLKSKKGIDFFMETLKKSQLLKTVHLRIVGEIEPHIEAQFIASNWSYSKIQPTSKTELMANYLLCDAVAIPSIYDGMPNVIFEAAALNIPVIASKAGGIPDILNHDNAFLFDVLSENKLLQALADFDNSTKTILQEKSNNLKQTIKLAFTTQQEIKNYIDIFNTITTTNYEI